MNTLSSFPTNRRNAGLASRKHTILGAVLLTVFSIAQALAQTPYSLPQAIDYAMQNSTTIKNATLDIENAKARIGETRAIGLPQISGQAQLQHNFRIQQFIGDGRAGSSPFAGGGPSYYDVDLYKRQGVEPGGIPQQAALDPNTVFAFAFGLKNNATVSATASQLLFNGSFFVALQASRAFGELSEKSLTSAKINVAESVTKAYYGVLVNQERFGLLNVNIDRLEKLLGETREFNKNGLIEKIDVDRLEVQFNNLKVESQNVQRLLTLTEKSLKFQMGMPLAENITLTEKLADLTNITFTPVALETVDYNQRIEYSLLQSQKRLNTLDVKNAQSGRYPTLGAAFTTGYAPAASRLQDILQSSRWLNYSFVALQLNVPIWNFGTGHQIQQKKIAVRRNDNDIEQFKRTADFQLQAANTTLENSLESLKTQKRNLDLAQEIVRVTRIKYQQGVGSNIEVINAEASFKESQTNYYAALYDALVAKVDLDKATGQLVVK